VPTHLHKEMGAGPEMGCKKLMLNNPRHSRGRFRQLSGKPPANTGTHSITHKIQFTFASGTPTTSKGVILTLISLSGYWSNCICLWYKHCLILNRLAYAIPVQLKDYIMEIFVDVYTWTLRIWKYSWY